MKLNRVIDVPPKSKVDVRVSITKYKSIFSKSYTEIWSREIFGTDSLLKTYPWTYKIKESISKEETIIKIFYENELLFE